MHPLRHDTDSDDRLAAICQEELARQATIVGRAATSVAWLKDVASCHDTGYHLLARPRLPAGLFASR